ncbi:MAG TPA: hypothetical protein VGO11_20260 [Chthoniobacteraceae bacterium]|jgi:hypothetical protein|nr:hypothetical protein [Chthoniobacteraceae bacterium]
MRYFRELSTARLVLWCYLIWYLFFVARYFEASTTLWMTSLGLSAIIGVALLLSTRSGGTRLGFWPTLRLFVMPFCVSSFSALVKGRGFTLVFSPHRWENFAAVGLITLFCCVVYGSRRVAR